MENATSTLTGCTISGNSANGYGGGGVWNEGGKDTLTGCTISNNTVGTNSGGGGMLNTAANTSLTNCIISGNSAGFGAGLWSRNATDTLNNCTVSGNSASSNGGGLLGVYGIHTLTNCTISGNSTKGSAGGGGMWSYGGTDILTNCTVSGNFARGSGGGLLDTKSVTATLTDCTFSGNNASVSGGGVSTNSGTVTIGNTILAGNTAATSGPDAFGTFASEGHNLIGKTDGSTGWLSSDLTGTIAAPLNALLASLGNYGGQTQTMGLFVGSPAIDAGSNALIPSGITTDARGLPRIVNSTVDIGAFEAQPAFVPSFVVTTIADELDFAGGTTSLREAIASANAFPGNVITFDPTVFAGPQTIALTSGQLTLSNTSGTVAITGPVAGVTVSGEGLSRVFEVDPSVTASFSGLTITGGKTSKNGARRPPASCTTMAAVTLTNCTITGNSAGYGGGLWSRGSLDILNNCTISGNSATYVAAACFSSTA